ncbi:hypothetical protein KIN20_016941 [Parelaphostrongylus tenuis]|uniref:Uncharacterized protein n=1 Tax=Parelaphostrongylus tenuis TaxID=148309 RepID=A0AAD5N1X6_PARTN|nr:hypothetical protein KIN20_016941 [Parelaphostrongylus tenuis]
MYPDEQPRWNFLYAIINTIYTPAENGKGDRQVVDTVYGRCQTYFSRPEDKRFRRQISDCEIKGDFNYTRVGGIQPVHYEQDASYLQNTKVDADIIVIDAVELLTFRTLFDKKWGFTLESKIHVEITNRSMNYVERHCSSQKQTAAVCAREKFGALTVGEKLYEKVQLGEKNARNKFAQLVKDYRSHLYDMGDVHTCERHSELFSQIVQESRQASEQTWKNVIMEPDNDPVLHVLGNVLGALGNSLSLKVAREVLFAEDPQFIDDYLFGAAHSTSYDEKWHKQLMYWLSELKDNEALFWKVANTMATILRRRCEQTSSTRNSCHNGKTKIVAKFIDDVGTFCHTEQCTLRALQVLRNIPISASLERARGFLCSNHSTPVQIAALQLIKASSSSLYDSKLSNVLIKIFRNVCPQPTSTGEHQLAADILLKSVPDQQHVGTMLLRSETTNPEDHEKWQYFYRAVKSSKQEDELKDEFWRKLRNFKVFRPNYAHRALIANSNSEWREIAEFAGYNLYSTASTEFHGDVFKRSDFDLRMKHKKQDDSLFGLAVQIKGLNSYDMEQIMSADPEAEVRLSLLGHALPAVTIFKGSAELTGLLWNADGQTFKAFEGNVMLRDSTVSLPLLSGLTVQVNSAGAVSLKMLTSSSVSLWDQYLSAGFKANVSLSLAAGASLIHSGQVIQRLSSKVAMVTAIGSEAEVSFG